MNLTRWRLTTYQRRSFVSSLFALTFAGAVVTVAASTILPCPARTRRLRLAKGGEAEGSIFDGYNNVVVLQRPQRWIQEKS